MPDNRKVVLIGPAHPLRGGLATYNERLVREYRKGGADASVITFRLQYPSILFPGKTQYSSEPAPSDIPVRIALNSINPFNWIRIGNELKKARPDLLIVKFWIPFMAPCFGTICRIARKNGHTRVVSIVDNIIPHEKRMLDRQLAAYWVNSADVFIAMSKAVLGDLEKFDTRKPKIYCPHPLYDTFGEPVSREEAIRRLELDPAYRYLLFFGFIRDYKGLDLLLKAFADPRIRESRLKLLVAGEFYTDPEPYHDLIRESGIGERIILSNDFIPGSEVVNYFCAADLVVQPYKSATQSGVTQVAYHFDKPMVITDVGGLSEFVPDGKVGYVVKPDPAEIADAILRFYREDRAGEFSANAALEKRKYSWARMVEAIDEAVNKL